MSIEKIFPSPEMTVTEQEILQERFSDPLIQKYLKLLAFNETKDLLALDAIRSSEYNIQQAFAITKGRLEVISTLLSLEKPERPPQEDSSQLINHN